MPKKQSKIVPKPVFNFKLCMNNASSKDIEVFKHLVEFIGKCNLKLTTVDEAIKLYDKAKKYDISELENRCLKFVSDRVTVDNVCQVFEFSCENGENKLIDICTDIFCWETRAVMKSPGFLEARVTTLAKIFQLRGLMIDSELELFEAVKNFAKFNANIDHSVLKLAMERIRFLNLTPLEFAEHVSHSKLLTADERLAILTNIISRSTKQPMPLGFSTEGPRRIPLQENFCRRFIEVLTDDVDFRVTAECTECNSSYEGYFIDHLFFDCRNFSLKRDDMKKILAETNPSVSGKLMLEKDDFLSRPAYQKAVCWFIKLNFSWISLHDKIYDFENFEDFK